MAITTKQAQLVRILARQRGLKEEEYQALLGSFGVHSAKELSLAQFDRVLLALRYQTSRDKQMGLIFHLWDKLYQAGKVQHREASACRNWMLQYLERPDGSIEFNRYQKSRCIERLKKWLGR